MICTQQHTIYRPVASTLKYLKWPTLVSKVHMSIRIFRYKTYTYQESTLFSEAIISNILLTVIICYISTYRCTLSIHPTPNDTYDLIPNSHRHPQAAPSLLYNLLAAGFWRSGSRHRRGRRWGTPPQGCPMWLLPNSAAEYPPPMPSVGRNVPMTSAHPQDVNTDYRRWWEAESNSQTESGYHGLRSWLLLRGIQLWRAENSHQRSWKDWNVLEGKDSLRLRENQWWNYVPSCLIPGTTNPLPSQSLLMFETC